METSKINIEKITQIPEKEFKEHFREWMEQDDVARCLQAKLRKDLILDFNKTALGKNLIAHSAASNRLQLSPLVLAINTLVAEFLYAQNCHFTLSVFCTEVPYRNALPDFESVRHFRFSEVELFEILEALSSKWSDNSAKDEICKQYNADKSSSLLFTVLKCLLHRPVEKGTEVPDAPDSVMKSEQKQEKRTSHDDYHLRRLNKLLKVFLKKVTQMSTNLAVLQTQKVEPQSARRSINMRKLDSLHRSMHKISENLRLMSVTKRKSRSINTIVSAINAMTEQFERCARGFHQAARKQSPVRARVSEAAPAEKKYTDWIREMRTTPNGKKFLEKVEQSLHKALLRERDKMEEEFDKRLQTQKSVLKSKHKQKLAEELSKLTSREKADTAKMMSDTLERIKEFEMKSKEVHEATGAQDKSSSEVAIVRTVPSPSCNKETQTSFASKPLSFETGAPTNRITVPDVEQIDNIVLDAKKRVQQLELESTQLEQSIREFLDKQKSEKKLQNETASSILSAYSVEKSILEKKCATFRPPIVPASAPPSGILPRHSAADSNKSIHVEEPISPTFENAFRVAHKQLLGKGKARRESLEGFKTNAVHQHLSSVFELINKNDSDLPPSPLCISATRGVVDLIKVSATAESGALMSEKGNAANRTEEHRDEGPPFEMKNNAISSESSGQQMNSNHREEAESAVKQINSSRGDDDAKELADDGVNATRGDTKAATSLSELETGTTSSHSFQYFNIDMREVETPKDSQQTGGHLR